MIQRIEKIAAATFLFTLGIIVIGSSIVLAVLFWLFSIPSMRPRIWLPRKARSIYPPPPTMKETKMNFGLALEELKAGKRIARTGWNGKGMWLAYSPGAIHLPAEKFWSEQNRAYVSQNEGATADVLPCITMKTATGEILMGWLASQTDMLADDWEVLPDFAIQQAA